MREIHRLCEACSNTYILILL